MGLWDRQFHRPASTCMDYRFRRPHDRAEGQDSEWICCKHRRWKIQHKTYRQHPLRFHLCTILIPVLRIWDRASELMRRPGFIFLAMLLAVSFARTERLRQAKKYAFLNFFPFFSDLFCKYKNPAQNVLKISSFLVGYPNRHRTWKSNMDEPIFFFFVYVLTDIRTDRYTHWQK